MLRVFEDDPAVRNLLQIMMSGQNSQSAAVVTAGVVATAAGDDATVGIAEVAGGLGVAGDGGRRASTRVAISARGTAVDAVAAQIAALAEAGECCSCRVSPSSNFKGRGST